LIKSLNLLGQRYKFRDFINNNNKKKKKKISETLSLDSSRENIYSIDPTLNSKIAFWKGSLTKLAVDVIVNAANRTFSTSRYGVNAAVHKYGGEELSAELKNMKGVPGDTKITKV